MDAQTARNLTSEALSAKVDKIWQEATEYIETMAKAGFQYCTIQTPRGDCETAIEDLLEINGFHIEEKVLLGWSQVNFHISWE